MEQSALRPGRSLWHKRALWEQNWIYELALRKLKGYSGQGERRENIVDMSNMALDRLGKYNDVIEVDDTGLPLETS